MQIELIAATCTSVAPMLVLIWSVVTVVALLHAAAATCSELC